MAMPAYPHKIPVKTGTETVYIRLFGDEHNKRAETLDGYTILQKSGEWYYAEQTGEGQLKASAHKLSANRDETTNSFLRDTPKHLIRTHEVPQPQTNRSVQRSATGERRVLVILMQFADVSFVKNKNDFNNLFNARNYTEDGAYGSVADYYHDVSYGKLVLESDILGPYTSRYNRAHYGGNGMDDNDQNPFALFEEAMKHAVDEVNLKDYDSDHDGYVDNIHIIFAGHGEEAGAPSEAIWSHEMSFGDGIKYQDVYVDRYSCAPELRDNRGEGISRIGPHCHEIGHALGAMDYYDTNYNGNGAYSGTGEWDIMASGSWNADGAIPADFNPYVKLVDFGWIEAPEMPAGDIMIYPSCESDNQYYRLSNTPNDYYLLENRTNDKWGSALPGSGLLIFHIHPNIANGSNNINTTHPQRCYPVCASSSYSKPSSTPATYGNIDSEGCPFPGSSRKTSFGFSTTPAAFSWNNEPSGIDIQNIQVLSEGIISLTNLTNPSETSLGDVLLSESFESEPNMDIETDDEWIQWGWKKFEEGEAVMKKDVKPHQGRGFVRLVPNKSATRKRRSSIIFQTAASPEETGASLSFYYRSRAFAENEQTLEVSYSCDGGDWVSTILTEDGVEEWKNVYLSMPKAKSYRIKFTGTALYGQGIYVDDIEVRQRIATSSFAPSRDSGLQVIVDSDCMRLSSKSGKSVRVYTLGGQLAGMYTLRPSVPMSIHLPRGIYVLATDQEVRKIRL